MVEQETLFTSATEFSIGIEKLAIENKSTLIEAMLQFCAEHQVEPEEVAHLVSKPLKDKLQREYVQEGYLKGNAELEL